MELTSGGTIGGISIESISKRVNEENTDQTSLDTYESVISVFWLSAIGDSLVYKRVNEEIKDLAIPMSPEVYGNVDAKRLVEYLSGLGFKIDRSINNDYNHVRLVIDRDDWIKIYKS